MTTNTNVPVSAAPVITYAPAKDSTLPLGSTTVTATATDTGGNATSCVFQVSVRDTTAPKLSCPAEVKMLATSFERELVSFELPKATDAVSSPTVTSSPASGSRFAVGTTPVTVTATDAAGNAATCTFEVEVHEPPTFPGVGDAGPIEDGPAAEDGCGGKTTGRASATSPIGLALAVAMLAGLRRRRGASTARPASPRSPRSRLGRG